MKKSIMVLLVGMLAFAVAGCSTRNDWSSNSASATGTPAASSGASGSPSGAETSVKPEDGARLTIWENEGAEGDWIREVAKKFTERYGVEVKFEPVPHLQAAEKIQLDGPAGVGADVFGAPHDKLGFLVNAGLVQENDLNAERYGVMNFPKSVVEGIRYDGKSYGFPIAMETYLLFYNKELVPQPPETFAQIVDFAKTYNNPQENKYALMWDIGLPTYNHAFIAGYGGHLFGLGGNDKNDIGLDSQGAAQGAEFFASLKSILNVKAADTRSDMTAALFNEGKAAMMISSPWVVPGMQAAGVPFGVSPLPKLPNGNVPLTFSNIHSLYVSAYTKYPIAAKLFAELASSDEMLQKRYEMTQQLSPSYSVIKSDEVQSNPLFAAMTAQLENSIPIPSIPEMNAVWLPYLTLFVSIWDQGTKPEEALQTAQKTILDAIAQMGQ